MATGALAAIQIANNKRQRTGTSIGTASASNTDNGKNAGGLFGGLAYLGEKAGLGFLSLTEGIWDFTAGSLADAFGMDEWAESQFANDWVNYNHADEWYDPGEGWKFAGDISTIVPYAAEKVHYGATQSLEGIHDYVVGGVASLAGADDFAKRMYDDDFGDYAYADRKYNVSGGWRKTAGDVAGGIGTSLPAIAAQFIPVVGQVVSPIVAGLGAAGNATKEAYRETGNLGGKEYGYGAMVGATEAGIEAISGGLGAGAKGIKNAITGGVKAAAKESAETITKKAIVSGVFKEMGKQALSEGAEEAIAEIMTPVWKRLTYDPNAQNATIQEIGYAAFVGAMSGAIMGGGATGINISQNYSMGNKAINNGTDKTILEKSRYFAEREAVNDTGLEVYKNIKNKYEALQKSLAEMNGQYLRMEQKIALGELNHLNAVAMTAPFIERSAQSIVFNAEVQAERLNTLGLKDANGKAINITAEMLTEGVDLSLAQSKNKADHKKFAKQLRKALSSNNTLATVATMEAAGELMMDAKTFAQAAEQGKSWISEHDFHHFVETATPEQKAAYGEEFGIENWDSLSYEAFQNAMAEYTTGPKFKSLIKQQKRVDAAKRIAAENTEAIPTSADNIIDGAHKFVTEDGQALGIIKEGKNYYIYDYASGNISFAQTKADINKLLSDIQEQHGAKDISAAVPIDHSADVIERKTSDVVLQKDGEGGTIEINNKQSEALKNGREVDHGGDGRRSPTQYAQKQVGKSAGSIKSVNRDSFESRLQQGRSRKRILSTDSEGVRVELNIAQMLSESAIVDSNGRIIAVYHSTNADFDTFDRGDIGFHFGSKAQANQRASDKGYKTPKYVRAYLNIKNPIRSPRDPMSWNVKATALNLWSLDVISDSERTEIESIYKRGDNEYQSASAVRLREILEAKGYDGIVYPNGFEGQGDSYIAFRDDQIIRVDSSSTSDSDFSISKDSNTNASNKTQSRIDSVRPDRIHEYLKENAKGYKTLSVPNQAMVRAIIRQGRILGIPDADLLLYAKVATRSGVNIVFDKEATYLGKDKKGNDVYADGFYERGKNQITVNPEGKRSVERLLSHELAHAIFKTTDGAIIAVRGVKNLTQDEKGRITQNYAKLHKNLTEGEISIKITDEQNAHYAEGMLSDRAILERLVADKPTLKDKILNFFKGAAADYADDVKLSAEAKKLYRQYKKLFDEFSAHNADTNAVERTVRSKSDEREYAFANTKEEYNKPITLKDIAILHSIGRKSINEFTSEDIVKAQKWAYKFYDEMGEKSPFFRAWFGDWRAQQTKDYISIANIPEYVDSNEARKQNRGTVTNGDTGWNIRISREGETNTISHSGKGRLSEYGLSGIRELIQNACLFDSETHEHHSNNAINDFISFDHKLYSLGRSADGSVGLYKITVEEFFQSKSEPANKKFHNLKYIEKVADLSGGRTSENARSGGSTNGESTTKYSIAELYNFVKQFDQEFSVGHETGVHLTNNDGTPKVFYHGTDAKFSAFDPEELSFREGSFFFAENREDAAAYGKNVYEVYLSARNLADYDHQPREFYQLKDKKAQVKYLKEKGYDGWYADMDSGGWGEVSVFSPTQIKSATRNIGTFNKGNPDINYALPDNFDWDSLEEIFAEADDTNSELFDADAVILKGAPTENLTAPKGIKQIVANFSNERVYGKGVMMSVINKLPDMRSMSLKSREEFASVLHEAYKQLDSADKRQTFAHDMAEYIVAREMREIMVDNPQIDTETLETRVAHLKAGIGSLAFSKSDLAEIRYNRDLPGMRSILGRWNKKRARNHVYTMEQFVIDFARETPGMEHLEDMHPVEAFLEMDDMYTKAKAELDDKLVSIYEVIPDAEINGMIKYMEESLLESFDNEGEGLKYFADHYADKLAFWQLSYKELVGRNEIINAIDHQMQEIRDLKEKTYLNASEYADGIFDKSIGVLASIKYKGNINPKLVRGAAKDLLSWYNKDNHLLEYVNESNAGYYVEDIHEALERLSNGKDKLSKMDLKDLYNTLTHFKSIMSQYNKVFINGKYVDALPLAKGFVEVADTNTAVGNVGPHNLFVRYMDSFGNPLSLMKLVDRYQDNGFNTFIFNTLQRAGLDAQIAEMKTLEDYEKFMREHKGYEGKLEEAIEYRARKMTRAQLIGLYMTSKREQAQAGLIINGYTYVGADGNSIRVPGWTSEQNISREELAQKVADIQREMEALFSADDKAYIKVVEAGFEAAKQMKIDRDMQRYGYTNALEGYYYPIRRANTAKSVDTSMKGEIERASNPSFNKDTVQGAKQELYIGGVDQVYLRHIHAMTQYSYLSPAIDTFNKLYNLDISGNKNKAVTVKTQTKEAWNYKGKDNTSGEHLGDKYFRKLIEDIQGISAYDEGGKLMAKMRGNYATFALGANPKVWATQFSSLFASTSMLDYDSVVASFKMDAKDVDTYCSLAQLRNNDNTAAKAQGVVNKLNKTADILMKPIGGVDRYVVQRLFAACQIQVQKNGGGKVGTDANKIAAGELLEKVILETQQNSLATERSGAMRSSSEFMKAITMFSADAMKVTGKVIDSYGEINAIDRRIKLLQKAQRSGATYLDETALGKTTERADNVANKKISAGMTDAERYEVLKDRSISLSAQSNTAKLSEAQRKLEISNGDIEYSKYGDRKRLFKKLGDEFSIYHKYNNADIELDFSFSKGNMSESVSKQKKSYMNLAKMLTCLDDVIDNAVGIEIHNRNIEGYKADSALKNVYVLASAFVDGENIIPVKLEVKEFSDKENTLHVAIALESIKKDGIVKQEVAKDGVARQYSPPSDISISEYFQKINPSDESFYKYIPVQFKNGERASTSRSTIAEEIESLKNQKKAAGKQLGRSVGAMASSALFMAIVAKLFRGLYHKDRDKDGEEKAKDFVIDFVGNFFGGLPIIKDVYARFAQGYELDNPTYSMINDVLNSASGLMTTAVKLASGEATSQDIAKALRNMLYAGGQATGIPTRNIYNLVYGVVGFNEKAAYKLDNVFYEKNYKNDLYKYIEDDNSRMVAFTMDLVLEESIGDGVSDTVKSELVGLLREGRSVLPRNISSTITYQGQEYKLSDGQLEAVRTEYADTIGGLDKLFSKEKYKSLSVEDKERAIKYAYDAYYESALSTALGIETSNNALISGVIGVENMALLSVATRGLESDKDEDGKTISGSKRKKVITAINSLGLSREKKLLLIRAKGYSIQDGDVRGLSASSAKKVLLRYILSLKVSKVEKARLAELCGFEVTKNGRIVTKNAFSA